MFKCFTYQNLVTILFSVDGYKSTKGCAFKDDDNTVSGGYQYDICLFVWIKTHFINLETASLLKNASRRFLTVLDLRGLLLDLRYF